MKPYYDEDGITIYHDDCRELLDDLPVVDAIVTDPPYGLGWASALTCSRESNGDSVEHWDIERPTDTVVRLVSLAPKVVIWGGNYFPLPISRGWLCWYKPTMVASFGEFELAWTNCDQPSRHYAHHVVGVSGNVNLNKRRHPAQKPLALMKWSMTQVGALSGIVLDPFMGSGTTLRAAKDMGMQAIGIEIEERYCEIAAKRMAQEVFAFA
jgi:site-specific DNA-methyltransferase (adenine-specific)